MAVVIQIENLVKRYKELVALDHLNLEVEEGEIFGLLGPNGSGKSTTINCILALLKYDKGTVKVFGREMKPDSYDIKREIGVVMQDVAVFDELTVYENVDYFCGLYIRDKGLRKQYVEDAIAFVGLDEFRKFYPKKLSGGLLRRLNIACGIAHKPKLIFFDEPTVAVDPQSRNKILEGIQKLNEEGATIVYTTHYMEEAANAGYVVILDKGSIAAEGTPFELKNDYVQDIVSVYGVSEDEIKSLNREYKKIRDGYQIKVRNTQEATKLIVEHQDLFTDYEVVKGGMDDVFLAVTGKRLEVNADENSIGINEQE